MKTNFICFSLVVALSASCTKAEKTTSDPFIYASGSDGSSVNSTGTHIQAGKNNAYPYPYLEVKGATSTAPGIKFWIYSYTATPGTIILDNVNAGASYTPLPGVVKTLATGSMTITSVSPNIVGTISFTCTDATVVTGSFNVVAP